MKASTIDCPVAFISFISASPTPTSPPSLCPMACRACASAGFISPCMVIFVRRLVTICFPAARSAGVKAVPIRFIIPCEPMVPMCGSIACCSSFSSDMEREEYMYPPVTSMCGRYFVLTLFRVFSAMSFFTFAMLSCLLFLSARARQESRDSVSAFSDAKGRRAQNVSNNNRVTFYWLIFSCVLSSSFSSLSVC